MNGVVDEANGVHLTASNIIQKLSALRTVKCRQTRHKRHKKQTPGAYRTKELTISMPSGKSFFR